MLSNLLFGDRVVDVDGREEQFARFEHLVEPVHAGGGLLGDAATPCHYLVEERRVLLQGFADKLVDYGQLLVVGRLIEDGWRRFSAL